MGFPKTGKAKNTQFEPGKGQREKGFRQWSEKEVTAAMQGEEPHSPKSTNPGSHPARKDASRQFSNPKGKKVF